MPLKIIHNALQMFQASCPHLLSTSGNVREKMRRIRTGWFRIRKQAAEFLIPVLLSKITGVSNITKVAVIKRLHASLPQPTLRQRARCRGGRSIKISLGERCCYAEIVAPKGKLNCLCKNLLGNMSCTSLCRFHAHAIYDSAICDGFGAPEQVYFVIDANKWRYNKKLLSSSRKSNCNVLLSTAANGTDSHSRQSCLCQM